MPSSKESFAELIRAQNYRIMDWKNGKGKTAEIAIFPSESVFPNDPFLWRLSSAQVTEGGEFSNFPGYQRFLTLVEGSGLKLHLEQEKRDLLLSKGTHCQFSGDEPAFCELVSGSVKDLNLIYQKEKVQANFQVIEISKKPRSFQVQGKYCFLFCISGLLTASVYPGEKKFKIQPSDTLRIDPIRGISSEDRLVLLESIEGKSTLVLIDIDC